MIQATCPRAELRIATALDGLRAMPSESAQMAVTSPPYWALRSYLPDDHPSVSDEIGREATPREYIDRIVAVCEEVRRVLRPDGVLWLNLGDTYIAKPKGLDGLKHKDMVGIPWATAFALREAGWYLRDEVIWHKPSAMPGGHPDKTVRAHEPVFLLTKRASYYFDKVAISERAVKGAAGSSFTKGKTGANGMGRQSQKERDDPIDRNPRSVWTIASSGFAGLHYAPFPAKLAAKCIKAGSSARGACACCGAPYRRQTTKVKVYRERPNDITKRAGAKGTGNHCPNRVAGTKVKTIGWEPTCDCVGAGIVPCTVVDPFAGSGTAILIAEMLGRFGVGFDIDERAVDHMALRRASLASAKAKARGFKPAIPTVGQMSLFSDG